MNYEQQQVHNVRDSTPKASRNCDSVTYILAIWTIRQSVTYVLKSWKVDLQNSPIRPSIFKTTWRPYGRLKIEKNDVSTYFEKRFSEIEGCLEPQPRTFRKVGQTPQTKSISSFTIFVIVKLWSAKFWVWWDASCTPGRGAPGPPSSDLGRRPFGIISLYSWPSYTPWVGGFTHRYWTSRYDLQIMMISPTSSITRVPPFAASR